MAWKAGGPEWTFPDRKTENQPGFSSLHGFSNRVNTSGLKTPVHPPRTICSCTETVRKCKRLKFSRWQDSVRVIPVSAWSPWLSMCFSTVSFQTLALNKQKKAETDELLEFEKAESSACRIG